MKKTTTLKAALVIFTLTALVVLPPVAEAVPIVSATAEATLGSDSPISDSDSGATAASASVVEPGNDPEYAGRGASDSTGRLAASANFFGASGTFATISAGATWTDTFEGIAGTQALFDFFIPGAGIGFSANNVPGLSGEFMVEILFNGISVFNSYTSVETDSNFPSMEGDFILTQEDTILTADFAWISTGSVRVTNSIPLAAVWI